MTSTVGNIALIQNTPQQAPATAASTASTSSASTVDTKPLVGGSSTPISPRIVVDPLAGVITEFLTSSGQVQSQIPSAAVVAYLRAGLTSDGEVKQTPGQQDNKSGAHSDGGTTA
jgi:hypothetical protein